MFFRPAEGEGRADGSAGFSLRPAQEGWAIEYRSQEDAPVWWTGTADPGFRRLEIRVDLEAHRRTSAEEKRTFELSLYHYPAFLIMMHHSAGRGAGLLIHGALVAVDGRLGLFVGRSGAGKSTLCRLLAEASGVEVFNDDRAMIWDRGQGFEVYSIPWIGEDRIAREARGPLAGLFFLHQAEGHAARRCSSAQALPQLFDVASIPWHDRASVGPALEVAGRLLESTPAYDLDFCPDPGVIEVIRERLA